MNLIMETAAADAEFVYNELYDQTKRRRACQSTSSRTRGRRSCALNGDVVFEPGLLSTFAASVDAGQTFVAVQHGQRR